MQFAFSSLPIQTYRYDAGHNWNEILGPGTGTQDDENKCATYLYIEATDDRKSSAGSSIEKSDSDLQQTHWIPVVCVCVV